ncbi:MAG TPA: alpha/beta hydrolase [Chitinophagaceae bacterium]|jgi:pimeloyl-ACP methyl ester carboxylesterase|nr:alpha/beta hydrolase [Chitinophagaceae bacterium]
MFRFLLLLLAAPVLFGRCSPEVRSAAAADSGTIRAGGLSVYYERQGSGAPLLLLHAGLQDHTMWDEQVRALSPGFTVVTIDLPFHGRTEGTDTSKLAREVIRTVLDSLHIRKAHVAGLSLGAAVAQDFIIAYPERVQKVVLLASGLNGYERDHPVDSVSRSWYARFAAALERKDTARAALEFTLAWGEGVRARGDSLTKPASRYVYRSTEATLRKHRMAGWPNLQDEPPASKGISGLRMPVLLLHGDGDLPFILTVNDYLEKTVPGARRVVLKGAAHMLNMEQPEEVNRLMLSFLKEG